jgi:putative transposase
VVERLNQGGFEVHHLCEALGLSRSAYYRWSVTEESQRELADQALEPIVRSIFLQHRRRYGSRRIAHELQSMGYACSRSKAGKILGKLRLVAIQPRSFKPRTTNSRHRLGYSPNLLLEGVAVTQPNQVWVGDITYVGLSKQFAYLAMLMDLCSRKIVGWALDVSMTEQLVIDALKPAIVNRQPPPQLIHHTDRGGQYASTSYRAILTRAQMRQSMSRAGDCYDNAFMESCFGTIKTELEMSTYHCLEHARREIEEYVNYYNAIRRHSSLGYKSPTSYEQAHQN